MNIVHVIAYYNPVWKYQENYLAEEQVKLGHKVHIVASNLNFPYTDYEFTAEKDIGPRKKSTGDFFNGDYHIHYLPVIFELTGRVWMKGLMDKVNSLNPDLLFCHGISQPATLQLIGLSAPACPKIVDEHVLYSDLSHSRLKRFFLGIYGRLFRRRIEAGYRKIVAIADGSRELLEKVLTISPARITMIPLGTDVELFRPDREAGLEFRKKHGIQNEALVVGYTGKIEQRKKIDLLIDVVNEPGMPPVHLIIAGNPEENYEAYIKDKLEKGHVPYLLLPSQPRHNLPSLYNACNLMVWPAHQTISMMDAASCGRPFICADYLAERLKHGQAIGIPSGNYEKLKEVLRNLLTDQKVIAFMGGNARKWAEEELSWKKINREFLSR